MWKSIYENMQSQLFDVVSEITSSMSAAISAPLASAMTIYILLYGIAILRGAIQVPIIDFCIRGLKLAVIWGIAANAGGYNEWAGSVIIQDLPAFIDELVDGPSQNVSDQIMHLMAEVHEAFTIELSLYDWKEIAVILALGLVMLVTLVLMCCVVAIVWGLTLWAYVGLALIAAVGPLFIAFALFDFSRGWFFSWLGQIVNFFLLGLLAMVLGLIGHGLYSNVLSTVSYMNMFVTGFNLIVASIALCFFFFLLPSIASALSSGAQASTGAVQRAVERRLTGGGKGGGGGGGGGSKGGSASKS